MCAALVVPTLAAGPFRLRPFALSNLDVVREAASDPLIPLITTVPAAFTEEEGRRFIERQWSRAEQETGYSLAIADAVTGHAVGQAGLWLKDLSQGRASVGYWVAASARGRRAASFAVAAWPGGLSMNCGSRALSSMSSHGNAASIRTAERAGSGEKGCCAAGKKSAANAKTC